MCTVYMSGFFLVFFPWEFGIQERQGLQYQSVLLVEISSIKHLLNLIDRILLYTFKLKKKKRKSELTGSVEVVL